jgi:hypothetical protein
MMTRDRCTNPGGPRSGTKSLTAGARRSAFFVPLILALLIAGGCGRSDKLLPYPHESILSAIGELKIWLRADPYREEPGRDLEGQSIFRATLARLDSMDELTRPEYDDILAFARAECYERLGEWTRAAEQFQIVADAGTSLSEEAAIRRQWVVSFIEAITQPPSIEQIEDYLDYLDARLVLFEQLRRSNPLFPYDAYIMIEMERTLEEKAVFMFTNRVVIPEGSRRAIDTGERLLREHSASRRLGEHQLTLGGFHEALARDYVRLNPPQMSGFDPETWMVWVEPAREFYAKAADKDGDPAKPEAQARLRALEALATRTLQRAR